MCTALHERLVRKSTKDYAQAQTCLGHGSDHPRGRGHAGPLHVLPIAPPIVLLIGAFRLQARIFEVLALLLVPFVFASYFVVLRIEDLVGDESMYRMVRLCFKTTISISLTWSKRFASFQVSSSSSELGSRSVMRGSISSSGPGSVGGSDKSMSKNGPSSWLTSLLFARRDLISLWSSRASVLFPDTHLSKIPTRFCHRTFWAHRSIVVHAHKTSTNDINLVGGSVLYISIGSYGTATPPGSPGGHCSQR